MTNLTNVYQDIKRQQDEYTAARTSEPEVRLWDGDWNLIDHIDIYYDLEVTFLLNEAGSGTIRLPLNSSVAQKMMDPGEWPTKSIYITVDKDGARWSGRLDGHKVVEDHTGESHLEMIFVHDYIKLKELLVWSNPFLPAEVQFPKAWSLYGPSKWAIMTTLFVNLLRKQKSLWMLPDDPLDVGQWLDPDLDMHRWNMVIMPMNFFTDTSLPAIVTSRFRTFHDCVVDIANDSHLSIEVRRWLDGDPPPWPGANLRNGCLVVDVVDKAGWNKETSFFGDLVGGLVRQIRHITGSDGITEGIDTIPRVDQPDEYYWLGWSGSLPEAPWVVLEHGEDTGVNSTSYEYVPPGPGQFVDGGNSMPGVNGALKAAITGIGGLLGSIFGQAQMGAVVAELLEPLYSDVFLAFKAEKDHGRIAEHGWDYPFEHWVGSGNQAYTLNFLGGMRAARHDTRERFSVTVDMEPGAPYLVGDQGKGDFFIGDRVAVHALGMPEDQLKVEMVNELTYRRSDDENRWSIQIGTPEFASGLSYLSKRLERLHDAVTEQGLW